MATWLEGTAQLLFLAATRRAVLQWVPAHCGISGNEQADILAKEGARGEQHAANVSFSEKKTLISSFRSQKDDYHLLSRKQQVVLVRLRTGHNRLNSHMHRKLKLRGILTNLPLWSRRPNHRPRSTKMLHSQGFKRRCVACQHSPDDQTLRLQAEAGEDDVIHLPSGLDLVDCKRQEEAQLLFLGCLKFAVLSLFIDKNNQAMKVKST